MFSRRLGPRRAVLALLALLLCAAPCHGFRLDDANRAQQAAARGDFALAIALFGKAMIMAQSDRDLGNLHFNRANVWAMKGDAYRAIDDYDAALERIPAFSQALVNRGVAWSRAGDTRRAMRDYDLAIAMEPGLSRAYYNRSFCWLDGGDRRRALQDLDTAIALDPADSRSYLNRARVRMLLGEPELAKQDFTKAKELEPGLPVPDLGSMAP